LKLQVTGMTCASCAGRVEKALLKMPGVTSAQVNLATERASVEMAPPDVAQLNAAVLKAGYGVVTAETTLQIEGMTCASCVGRVEKALLKLPGVLSVAVNLATERATVQALSTVPPAVLRAAVVKAGYTARDAAVPALTAAAAWPTWAAPALGAVLTLPLVAPMLLALFGLGKLRSVYMRLRQKIRPVNQ
jgi:Cu+-exporting ATPase